jgi:hypothetical protein
MNMPRRLRMMNPIPNAICDSDSFKKIIKMKIAFGIHFEACGIHSHRTAIKVK